MADKYDDAAADVLGQQAVAIRNNVASTVNQSPDQAAQYQSLAKAAQVPVQSVYSDPAAIKQQVAAKSIDADRIATQYPHLAQFLTQPDNVAVAHDDVQNLAATETAVKSVPAPATATPQPPATAHGLLADIPVGIQQSGLKLLGSMQIALANLLPPGLVGGGDTGQGLTGTPLDQAAIRARGEAMLGQAMRPEYTPQHWTGSVASGLTYAPAGIAAIPLIAGAEGKAHQYALQQQGVDPTTAGLSGTVAGAVMGAAQMIPMGKLGLGALGLDAGAGAVLKSAGTALAKTTAAATLKAGAVGAAQSVIGDTGTAAILSANGYGAIASQAAPTIDKAWDSALFQAGLHVGMQALHPAMEVPQKLVTDALQASEATSGGEQVQALSQIAAQSALRDRAPDVFHGYIKSMTDDGNAPDLYINAQKLGEVLHQAGMTPEQFTDLLPDAAAQMREGLETQGDVKISLADYSTHIAGKPLDAALLPNFKSDPEGFTFAQGPEHLNNLADEFKRYAEAAVSDHADQTERDTQLDAIQADTKAQLDATGRYPQAVTNAYAGLHRAWYDTMADRTGMSPADLREAYPLAITTEGSDGYSQGETARGGYSPGDKSIGLNADADLSTFLHESGHFFLDAMHGIVKGGNAPDGIKSDFDTLLRSFSIEGATPEERFSNWEGKGFEGRRDGHEQFAESFETYLREGKAPTPELQSMFGRFRSWLVNVYKGLVGQGFTVTPEVKGVMDRMLASQEAIEQAEKIRAYYPMGIDPLSKDGQEYAKLGQAATEQAITDMQTPSLRNTTWARNAHDKASRALRAEADARRAEIEEKVTKEVMDLPINKARTWLTKGETTDDKGNLIKAEKGYKLNTDALREMFPKDSLTPINLEDLRGMTSEEGLPPDLVANMFGFGSGRELVGALEKAEDPKVTIEGLTDSRMLEEHGDLTDPASIARAADAAIHNELRAKMMATGLKILTKSPVPAADINAAAKEAAETAIAAKQVGEVRPKQYGAAETRANKEMLKLAPRDPQGAAQAQRAALLANRLFKAATTALDDVRTGLGYLNRFNKAGTRAKIDVDIRDQIDDLLGRFDLRKNPTDAPTRAQRNLEEWRDSQVAAGLMPSITDDMLNPQFRTPYKSMTVEQFRGLVDTVKSMEEVGKQRNRISVKGERVDLKAYLMSDLVPKMQEAGENFTPLELYTHPEERGLNGFQKSMDQIGSWFRSMGAQLKPQSFKANFYDRHEVLGPFADSIFNRIFDANYRKGDMEKALSDSFIAKADELGKDWQDSLREPVTGHNLGDKLLTDRTGTPVKRQITRGMMLMIALHSGNESNFDKLTKGNDWAPSDVWNMLSDNMTAKDIDAVNHIWKLYESHWPEMEAMQRRMGQTMPPKIEARATDLPNGRLTGGYAHIDYDPLRSRFGEKAGEGKAKELAKGASVADYFNRTGTTNGALNKRNEGYTDSISLDFHGIAQAMRETMHDLAYREALVDVNKILEHPEFKQAFLSAYGRENLDAMHTWLGRVANANASDVETEGLAKWLAYARTGLVVNAIALRATTVLKHGGSAGIKTLGYFAGGGEKYLASRMASMGSDYTNQIESAQDKFPEIRARLRQQDRDYKQTAGNMFEPESPMSKAERFGHSAVAWSDMMTAVPTAWAAYDRAITEGIPVRQGGTGKPMTEAQAVAYANQVVREAHGSNIESARSNVLTTPSEGFKMLTTLYGFMNNTYGQMTDTASKLRAPDIGKPEVLARAFMALIVPGLWAGYLTQGTPKDKSGTGWLAWMGKCITEEMAGTVPVVRDAFSMWEGMSHAGQVGIESWMQTLVQAAHDGYKAATGEPQAGKHIQDYANAVGVGLHIPGLGQLGKTAQYAADRSSGKQPAPAGTWRDNDLVNAVVGAPKKEK